MRAAGESLLSAYPTFRSVAGTAEATTLPDRSVDMIVAGQAFHWFDRPKARTEFVRILRAGGPAVLMWNTLKEDATPFMKAYIALLSEYGTDYRQVVHTNLDRAALRDFYGSDPEYRVLPNEQAFDRAGLHSRVRSSSYTPPPGHPNHEPMVKALDRLFDQYNDGGAVRFVYDTEVNFGRLG
jgi:hypothetical protein